jgi:FtsP/CotA-like multicopper oxidase with cupredoxin domain
MLAARAKPRKADAMNETKRADLFTTEIADLEKAQRPNVVRLANGDRFDLRVSPLRKRINDAEVRMLGYNGSIPGPTLHVDQGSQITVETRNEGDVETTVHWHGLRLDNRYDGVPEDTQEPIRLGETYTCKVRFPDPGLYWYHPHLREDFAQEMGLYAAIVVEPSDPVYWPPTDRFLTITLDDLLIEDGEMAPFHRSGPTFTAMGRIGNVMLINGETTFSAAAAVGEVVRLYLVNTANTRIFNFALRGARMKLVGGDSGRHEREEFVDEVLLSPSERVIVDVLFETPGEVVVEHRTPDDTYELGTFTVDGTAAGDGAGSFDELRVDPELSAERKAIERDLDREPDKVLAFRSQMPILYGSDTAASSYACPMHPEVTATEQEACPKCGMKLVAVETSYVCPMHPEVIATEQETCPKCGMKLVASEASPASASEPSETDAHHDHGDGLEWEDLMPEINRQTTPENMIWQLVDRETGAENADIAWAFTVGDRVKIRLVNEIEGSDHPMHHPFHIHGAGRFLILARDGEQEGNLVWKDTVLVRAGQTVDILLDVTNPGRWMAHCHIAEHTESGMMFTFDVAAAADAERAE